LLVSGHTPAAFSARLESLERTIADQPEAELPTLLAELHLHRQEHRLRRGAVVSSREEAPGPGSSRAPSPRPPWLAGWRSCVPGASRRRSGALDLHLGRGPHHPDRCSSRGRGRWHGWRPSCRRSWSPPPTAPGSVTPAPNNPGWSLLAVAAATWWQAHGLRAEVVLGHSVGELAARGDLGRTFPRGGPLFVGGPGPRPGPAPRRCDVGRASAGAERPHLPPARDLLGRDQR
jgi:hypothetical protein